MPSVRARGGGRHLHGPGGQGRDSPRGHRWGNGGDEVVINAPLVELAGNADAVAKGAALNTAIANLGTAVASAITALGAQGDGLPVLGLTAKASGTR